ncbi:hypothetical protein [Candidatus Korobacter versatilis]|uniref:hypothetical protein n=1 Tax=Candidatus Korobacter versatilis TaxID=658062 RepID=UPI0005A4B534|nr:hypothetical protein [Candidatus Koribacter versatilis]
MQLTGIVLFAVAAIFYLRPWKYIHRLVTEVNQQNPQRRYSTLNWLGLWGGQRYEPWRLHSRFYPSSSVRKQISWNIAMTLTLWFVLIMVEVRWFLAAHP